MCHHFFIIVVKCSEKNSLPTFLLQSGQVDLALFLDWFDRHLSIVTTCEFLPHHVEHPFTAAPAEQLEDSPAYACIEGHLGICSCVAKATMRLAYSDGKSHSATVGLPRHLRMDVKDERILLNLLLLINTEVSTLWNVRRCHFAGLIDSIDSTSIWESISATIGEELNYVRLCLSVRPKSQTVFQYRHWLLCRCQALTSYNQNQRSLALAELELVFDCGRRYKHNYAAWDYARLVLLSMAQPVRDELLQHALAATAQFQLTRLTDISAVCFKIFLLENCQSNNFIGSEADWLCDLLGYHPVFPSLLVLAKYLHTRLSNIVCSETNSSVDVATLTGRIGELIASQMPSGSSYS